MPALPALEAGLAATVEALAALELLTAFEPGLLAALELLTAFEPGLLAALELLTTFEPGLLLTTLELRPALEARLLPTLELRPTLETGLLPALEVFAEMLALAARLALGCMVLRLTALLTVRLRLGLGRWSPMWTPALMAMFVVTVLGRRQHGRTENGQRRGGGEQTFHPTPPSFCSTARAACAPPWSGSMATLRRHG
jgi:hypothetical protein